MSGAETDGGPRPDSNPRGSPGPAGSRAYLSVGSNILPYRNVPAALKLLSETPGVTLIGISTFYRTTALPHPTQHEWEPAPSEAGSDPDFLNGVLEIRSRLGLEELRTVLSRTEKALGRRESASRYAPRTMDLDLLLFSRPVVEPGNPGPGASHPTYPPPWREIGPNGLLIHPDVLARVFVAAPLLELAPDLLLPPLGTSLQEAVAEFDHPPGAPDEAFTRTLRSRFLP